jgi:hypothetical protein
LGEDQLWRSRDASRATANAPVQPHNSPENTPSRAEKERILLCKNLRELLNQKNKNPFLRRKKSPFIQKVN